MAGRIPQPFIDELIARADIVELIGSRVQLKKAGREFKACCPFHNEKTPSFTVSQTKQFYHCFGCGVHGTALGFLMEYDRLSFVEAVEELAQRLGLDVPREAGESRAPAGEDLYELMGKVAQFYCEELEDDQRAIDYLKQRGLTGETAAAFRIGYAPDSWNAVLKKFADNDAARRRLLAAGLVIERERSSTSVDRDGGFYDRFRDRIMFPIRDARGRVIAFGGRILDKGEPKYLNSPETAVFHKGRELYGLYEARQSRQALKRLLIVEGYMDVVRLHQAGVQYAVATLGTSTTTEHLSRVFRLVRQVVFCFDGDRAGRAAAWRALENALAEARADRDIRFMFLPEGDDPDSLVGKEGRDTFENRLTTSIPLHRFLIQEVRSQAGPGQTSKIIDHAKSLVDRMPVGLYRDETINELARTVGLTEAHQIRKWINDDTATVKPSSTRPVRAATSSPGWGRPSPVRQAITLLLNFPEAARWLTVPERLTGLDQPGVALLAEMISDLKEHPAPHKAALVERWRERPEGVHLDKLATLECLVTDARAAAQEIDASIDRLVDDSQRLRRTNQLLEKDRKEGLTRPELLELNELLKARPRGNPENGGLAQP